MLIQRISVSNFMAHGEAVLELPEAGVTVLTGANGAGKSRFIEAVAYAFWGETLRGESPWIEGVAGSCSVLTDIGDATRKATKGGHKTVLWNGEKADTPSRTQELISARVPEFAFWRRTHVFSSGEAAHFSSATDGEKKRIMEMLLGMEVFDRAQRECLDELGALNAQMSALQTDVARAEGAFNVATAKLTAHGSYPAWEPGTPPAASESDPQLAQEIERAQQALQLLEHQASQAATASKPSVPQELSDQLVEARAAARSADHQLELARGGNCPECGQVWAGASVADLEKVAGEAAWTLEALEQAYQAERLRVDAEATAATVRWRQLDADRRAAAQRIQALDRRWREQLAAVRAHQAWQQAEDQRALAWERGQQTHEAKRLKLRAEAMVLEDELNDLKIARDELASRVFELQVTGAVLGVRGLRGHVLGRALDGVEAVANYWLQQIAPGRALTVRADGETGKISIGLRGMGGGRYKAASSGERRRVDAPLLLALAEVAGHGNTRGTLFLDEVFDALDRDGRALVCQALAELGQTQSVVVITHQDDLARSIQAVQRFEVSNGELRTI